MLTKYTLPNGIPLFVYESSTSPVVSVQAWVSRGSIYEDESLAGISHFLEHALFKGTRKRKVGQIASEIESRGGEINAFTSFEETVYYATLASRYFETGMDVISDALISPLFDPVEMEREREVILEEIKRAQDSPARIVSQNLWRTHFKGSPYGRPVLGYEETVSKIDSLKLNRYFSKHYHAGTTSLFIVGDVAAPAALKLAKKYFGKMKRGIRGASPGPFRYPKWSAPQIVSSERPIQECQIQLAVRAQPITDPLVPVADIMCSAIGQGESSRLYQRLVKELRLAMDVQMGLVSTQHCGLAAIGISAVPEKAIEAVQECWKLLNEISLTGLLDREIDRVKSSLEAEVVSGKETVDGYARRLGHYYIEFGDPEYEKKYLEMVLNVTSDAATEYLQKCLSQTPVVSLVHPTNFQFDSKKMANAFSLSPKKRKIDSQPPQLELLKKGTVRVITKPIRALPIMALRFVFPGGSREEKEGQLGISTLFHRLWTSGTPSFSCLQIAHLLESLGASVHGYSGRNTVGLSLEFLSKQWTTIKPVLSEILLNPTFPATEFETEREILLQDIKSETDSPAHLCQLNFLKMVYGNHPFGRSSLGKKEDVENLTPQHLKKYHQDFIHRGNLIISSVGSFEKDFWSEEIEGISQALPSAGLTASPYRMPDLSNETKIVREKRTPLFQTHLLVGFLGPTLNSPERYALKLLASCLTGQGGRLFLELRDKQSLAYTVSPIATESPERGVFAFYIGCSPEKLEQALRGIRIEIDKVIQHSLSSVELDRAKRYWIGRLELDMQRYGSQAAIFASDEYFGLGFDHHLKVDEWIKPLTPEDIRKAAEKFLTPNIAAISVVAPELMDEERIRRAWRTDETPKKSSGRRLAASPPQ